MTGDFPTEAAEIARLAVQRFKEDRARAIELTDIAKRFIAIATGKPITTLHEWIVTPAAAAEVDVKRNILAQIIKAFRDNDPGMIS